MSEGVALFSEDVFKRYLIPKLLKIFCVRDIQIRMILLSHFHLFSHVFTTEQLKHQILPEVIKKKISADHAKFIFFKFCRRFYKKIFFISVVTRYKRC